MSGAIAALQAQCAEPTAWLAERENQAVPIRVDLSHLDATIAILRADDVPWMLAQHQPEWFANLRRLILDVLRGAPEPMTARAIAVEIMRLAGHGVGNRQAVEIMAQRVRVSLMRRIGIVERVAVGQCRKGWRIVC